MATPMSETIDGNPSAARSFESMDGAHRRDRVLCWVPAGDAGRRLATAWLSVALLALGVSGVFALAGLVSHARPLAAGGGAAVLGGVTAGFVFPTAVLVMLWALPVEIQRWRWGALGLAAAGLVALLISPLIGDAPRVPGFYIPALDNALFLVGLTAIVIAAGGNAIAVCWPRRGLLNDLASQPAFAAVFAAAAVSLMAGVSLIWSAFELHGRPFAIASEILFWGPGHYLQAAFGLLLATAWLVTVPATALRQAWFRQILICGIAAQATFFAVCLGLHGFGVESPEFRKGMSWAMRTASWWVPAIVGVCLLAMSGRWLREVPVAQALAVAGSMLLFVAGCGIAILIRGDGPFLIAHARGVLAALTIALMALASHLLNRWGVDMSGRMHAATYLLVAGGGIAVVVGSLWAGLGGHHRALPNPLAVPPELWSGATLLMTVGEASIAMGTVAFALLGLSFLGRARSPTALLDPLPPERGPIRSDGRRRGILLFGISTLGLGALLSVLPKEGVDRETVTRWLEELPAFDRLSQVADQRRREIGRRFEQGVAMLHARQYDFAIAAFHQVLRIDPKIVEAHVNMGYALLGAREFRAARDFFESAIALRPRQINAYYGLALAYDGMGEIELALGAMRTYDHLAPRDDPFRRKAAAAVWEWEEALAAKRRAGTAGGPKDGKKAGER